MRIDEIKYVQESEVLSPDKYPIQQKYDEYNSKFFNNQLPKIPLLFSKLKNVGGKVDFTVVRDAGTPIPNPILVRLGKVDKYAGGYIKPGSMKMTISTLYLRDEENLNKILLHEMLHVYFAAVLNKFSEQHGPEFLKLAKELSIKSGMEIPLTDNTTDLVLNSTMTKPVLVILLRKKVDQKDYSFAVLNLSLRSKLDEMIERWKYFVNNNYVNEVYIFEINTPVWTQISASVPVQRKFGSDTKYYQLKTNGATDDLEANGKLLSKISKG